MLLQVFLTQFIFFHLIKILFLVLLKMFKVVMDKSTLKR